MQISAETLRAKGACTAGIEAFGRVFPDGFRGEFCATMQALILGTDLRTFFGWAVANGVVPIWSMAQWNLYGANLTGANLYGADLYGADLTGAELSNAIGYST